MAATPVSFLQQTLDELKKVVWPKRTEVIRLTAVVIIISLIVGLYIGGLDFMFTKMIQAFLTNAPAVSTQTQTPTIKISPVPVKSNTKPAPKPTAGKLK